MNQGAMISASNIMLSSVTQTTKYGGLVSQKPMKILRNSLFNLFAYIDSSTSPFTKLHTIISIWRLLQLYGPSFQIPYKSFWDTESPINPGLIFFSIVFHIFPAGYRNDASFIFSIIYIIFTFFLMGIILFLAFYFKSHAKLPAYSGTVVITILQTVMYIIQPVNICLELYRIGIIEYSRSINNLR